ncbi:filamentous hemagglutinin N-terminal domain-containing protein [PVC group bacterium]|nr:filamentous hemagglutinin N-terminal domain-containing protein [PVC group bacterium]
MNEHLIWNELGNINSKMGNIDKAMESFQKAIEIESAFGLSFNNLGICYQMKEKCPEAILLYQKSLDLLINDKESALVWKRMGEAYASIGDYARSLDAYQNSNDLISKTAQDKQSDSSWQEYDENELKIWLQKIETNASSKIETIGSDPILEENTINASTLTNLEIDLGGPESDSAIENENDSEETVSELAEESIEDDDPEIDEISSGDANISYPDPSTLRIDAADNTIINYQTFNINEGESVLINLPTIDSRILNRVIGGQASQLLGNLEANGLFILINQAGIYVGPNASIDAQSLILSTRNISDQDFLDKNYLFQKLSDQEFDRLLLNEGRINIREGGFGVLIAGAVENRGVIVTRLGKIALAGGDAIKLDISGDGLISVAIKEETASEIVDMLGNPITDQIKNTGTIEAPGGEVLLNASSITDIFSKAINLEGYVMATRVEVKDGVVWIVADGDVRLAANLDATSVNVGEDGGVVPENVSVEEDIKAEKEVTILADNNIEIDADIIAQ